MSVLGLSDLLISSKSAVNLICFGAEGQKFANELTHLGIPINFIAEDDLTSRQLAQKTYPDTRVTGLADFEYTNNDSNIFVICSHSPARIYEKISPTNAIQFIPLFALQCLYPEHFEPFCFYKGLQSSDKNHSFIIDYVRTLLSDSESISIFDSVIEYRRTFDQASINSVTQSYDEILASSLFSSTKIASYLDGGVFNGDTIDSVIRRFNNIPLCVHAFEPSTEMASFLRKKYSTQSIHIHEAALSDQDGFLSFSNDNSRTSMADSSSSHTVKAVALDSYLADTSTKIDFIKLNIEGSELDALSGAKARIQADKPILAIHAYHKPSHIWEVPLMIKSINPEYKLYFRQQDSSLMESVFFAFP